MPQNTLLIKNCNLVDGTGQAARPADIAIREETITEVGENLSSDSAERVIDADGRLVTPGFVDIHTHYDGQATWDPILEPSVSHGVTSVVMGNCGVGFAPVQPGQEEWLIQLMEGVEDIPGSALSEGIDWDWETFPEYLDALDKRSFSMNLGAQIAHGAVRGYIMGERGAKNEPATPEEIAQMKALVKEALQAGAMGFSTSRTIAHKAMDGEPVPGTFAAEDELFGIGEALAETGLGIFELAPAGAAGEDIVSPKKEVDWMCRLSKQIQRPVTFALTQVDAQPELYRELMEECLTANQAGSQVFPQVGNRPAGVLVSLTSTHTFSTRPTFKKLAEKFTELELPKLVAELQKPENKAQILKEKPNFDNFFSEYMGTQLDRIYVLGSPPDYEPGPEKSVVNIAAAENTEVESKLYDLLLENNGRALLLFPLLNYSDGNADATREMLLHPASVFGLGDGGAHCGAICDASMTTWSLVHWGRDRERGEKLPLELIVQKQTSDTARLFGIKNRGAIKPGMRADINVIDFENLGLMPPEYTDDLPAGGRRFIQKARGYDYTLVSGVITRENDQDTGARPGRLLRAAN